jgi:HPt (histidine-containing phosphotransfer) domain-containing protein
MPDAQEDMSTSPFKLDDDDMMPPLKTEPAFKTEPEIEESDFNPFAKEDDVDPLGIKAVNRSNLPDIPMLGDQLSKRDQEYIDTLSTDKDYAYNPEVAANELGLPVDLIEEFIGDFIQQSHDFHDELFEKAAVQDRETIQTLSHKLKGVAANLRIEDAFEVLTIINTSHDFEEIKANLKYYYYLVAKLEGDEEYLTSLNEDTVEESHDQPEEEEKNIYDFDAPEEENEALDIPEKPPVFENEEIDDDIYDLDTKSEAQSQDNDVAQEETAKEEEEDLFELKQDDDEPYLIMDPEQEEMPKTSETLPDREFLDVVDTLDSTPVDSDEDFKFDAIADELKTLEEPSSEEVSTDPDLSTPEIEIKNEDIDMQTPEVSEEETLHYNLAEASHELGLSEELVKNLVQDFKTDTLSHIDDISTAITSFDTTTWQRLANEYKGISDNLRLVEISNELQILIRTNDAQKAKAALSRYRNYVNQL